MSRIPIAVVVGLFGFAAYVALVVMVADHVITQHWALQGLFFLVAGKYKPS